jgi:hypothetical protein
VLAQHSPRFFSWVFVTVLTYTLPIVLAAGVEMYLLDRASAREPVEGADYASVAILTFIGAAGLAFFALLSYKFVMVRIVAPTPDASIAVWRLLPWSLPPAMIATVFLVMAGREPRLPRGVEAAVDAVTHGTAAALASTLAMFLSAMAGQGSSSMPDGMLLWIAPITAAAIGGSIGGVLCTTCRHRLHTPQAPAAQAPAPGTLQPAGAF